MTDFQLYALIGLGLYFALMIIMGLVSSREETHEGFVIGSRNVGLIPTLASVSTSFRDGSGAVFWVGAGLGAAYGGLWMAVGLLVASLFFVVYGERVRQTAKKHDFITIGEIIRHYTGPYSEKTISLLVLSFSLIAIAMQLYVSGNIFAQVIGVQSSYGILSAAAVVGIYMFFGGYSTVIKTDFLQFFIIISLIIFPFIMPPSKDDALNFESFYKVDFEFAAGLFMIGCFYILSGAETWQRVFSAKNKKVVQLAFPASVLFLLFMTLCLIWIGMGTKHLLGDVEPSQALFKLFTLSEDIPVWLLSYFAVVLMAITMSTLDSFCYLFAATLGKNILPAKMTAGRAEYVRFAQIVIIVILFLMSLVAMNISDVIEVLFSSVSLLYIISPVYIFTVLGIFKAKEKWLDMYITISIIACAALHIYLYINGTLDNMLYTGLSALVITVLLSSAAIFQRLRIKEA